MAIVDLVQRSIDLALRNIRTGRFQRSLALATAVGSVITAAEIYLEHDRAGFGNRMMWWPMWLGPVGAVAGVAGALSPRAAHTLLPVASAAITVNACRARTRTFEASRRSRAAGLWPATTSRWGRRSLHRC